MNVEALRGDFFRQCERYWPTKLDAVRSLPLAQAGLPDREPLPPSLRLISLPEWAADAGVDGCIAVPTHCMLGQGWEDVDWPLAGAWFLHSLAERTHEQDHGPAHSYALHLKGWPDAMWRRAWANRIALFLRRWSARQNGRSEEDIFGPLPEACITLTFDVDAVRLTIPIRLKQGAFNLFNALRALRRGRGRLAARHAAKACRFLVGPPEAWPLEAALDLCRRSGLRAVFNFPGLPGPRAWQEPKRWLLDPGYDPEMIRTEIRSLAEAGHGIGLHPSFLHFADPGMLTASRERLEAIAGRPVSWCRQHWLRFSFADTWKAQKQAGLTHDCTLGFNDVTGFRNAAALAFSPWDEAKSGAMDGFTALPLVFMDSQAYDYGRDCPSGDFSVMATVIDEIRAVGGEATVLWHPHTLFLAYGWEEGVKILLKSLAFSNADVISL